VVLGQRLVPLESVGIYVPGGRAAYPSSLLMAAVPARVAGVSRIVVVSPPDERGRVNSTVLAAAGLLGIEEVYRVGGAQAIAALAFGTETIRPVDKIVGPGNAYVAEAKRQVFGICGIDMIAGPSEVVVLADETADPSFVAADLLAQAEHDPLAASIAVVTDSELADAIAKAVQDQARTLSRKAILEKSLDSWGGILLAENLDRGIDLVNRIAPEHLGLAVREPWEVLGRIRNAGAIFLGHYAPETVGDYWAGPNHILPTGGTARFASPLSTEDFYKKSNVTFYTREALEKSAGFITRIAEREGLDAHAQAVNRRLK
jgi:histidinol dehydrogenase